jgi:hypothetical protein
MHVLPNRLPAASSTQLLVWFDKFIAGGSGCDRLDEDFLGFGGILGMFAFSFSRTKTD